MYDRIVCAVGLGSRERAERLLKAAGQLLNPGGTIFVCHAIERSINDFNGVPDSRTVLSMTEARDKLTAVARHLHVIPAIEIRVGRASDVLLQLASEHSADLIVVAAHRMDILDYIFGATVDRIVHHAKCSVHIDRIP